MAIPDFQSLMLPLLEAISDGGEHSNQEVSKVIGKKFELTEDDLNQMLPSGQNKVFTNRLAWAKLYLKKAGLLEIPKRAFQRITPKGQEVLANPPDKLNIRFLKQFHEDTSNSDGPLKSPDEVDEQTPLELMESSFQKLREKLADGLLEQVKACSPSFFEKLTVDLLKKMGYGNFRDEAGKVIGGPGDGGIDGIIDQDDLGLDSVYIQAKRWEGSVPSSEVREFAGSMEGFRAKKGVMITTATFTKDALKFIKHIDKKIVLIDGIQLALFMIDHGIGVETSHEYKVKKVDLDYFTDEEE